MGQSLVGQKFRIFYGTQRFITVLKKSATQHAQPADSST